MWGYLFSSYMKIQCEIFEVRKLNPRKWPFEKFFGRYIKTKYCTWFIVSESGIHPYGSIHGLSILFWFEPEKLPLAFCRFVWSPSASTLFPHFFSFNRKCGISGSLGIYMPGTTESFASLDTKPRFSEIVTTPHFWSMYLRNSQTQREIVWKARDK